MSRLLSGGYVRAVLSRVRDARLWVPYRKASGGPGCAPDPPAGAGLLRGELDRFGGVSVRLDVLDCLDAAAFQRALQGKFLGRGSLAPPIASEIEGIIWKHCQGNSLTPTGASNNLSPIIEQYASLRQWRSEGRIAVWLHVPILQSALIAPAAALGFRFHHAEADSATLTLWLGQGPSRLPGYATHQVGVAGAVFDENTGKILVVQDRNKISMALLSPGDNYNIVADVPSKHSDPELWKVRGAASKLEVKGDTAVREVFEETGVRSEFRSLLGLRQQHSRPGAFGKSDMYLVCRLQPRSFAIQLCPHECLRGEWMDLAALAASAHATPIARRAARLLLYGHQEGFDKVDLTADTFPATHTGLLYKLYHRELPGSYKALTGVE